MSSTSASISLPAASTAMRARRAQLNRPAPAEDRSWRASTGLNGSLMEHLSAVPFVLQMFLQPVHNPALVCARRGASPWCSASRTVAFEGIEARAVDVQVQVAPGLPAFNIVGLPDKAVAESRERVRAALVASGLALPAAAHHRQSGARRPAQGRQPLRPADRARPAGGDRRDPARRGRAASRCSASSASTARSRRSPACCWRRSAPMRAARG